MESLKRILSVIGLVVPLAAGCSSSGSSSSGTSSPAAAAAPADKTERSASAVLDLTSMLTGTFEGTTPGNNLNVIVTGAMSPSASTVYNLPVRVTGKYQDVGVREQGVIRLENQGRGVSLQYIPHFDPTVGGLSTQQLQFTPQEAEAACNFDVTPRGDGFFAETTGSTTCARAIRGAVGKWSFEVEPGTIRIRNSGTGETLRFKRVSK